MKIISTNIIDEANKEHFLKISVPEFQILKIERFFLKLKENLIILFKV